jgi:hypothetical protein
VAGDLARYSEAVMAFYDVLTPDLKKNVEPFYDEIQKDIEAKVAEVKASIQGYSNPLDQAGLYQTSLSSIERESADKLFRKMIAVLDKAGLMAKRRDIELRTLERKK